MSVEQHPVPQHISSYEFRLIGEMTLKQFGWLCAGAALALITYYLPIPGIFKWPLIGLFGFAGFAFAFLPLEGRPLTTWLIAFYKATVSPTLFIWQKKQETPAIFEASKTPPVVIPSSNMTEAQINKQNLDQYLEALPLPLKKAAIKTDQNEKDFLKNVNQLFESVKVEPSKNIPEAQNIDAPEVSVSPQPTPHSNQAPLPPGWPKPQRPTGFPPKISLYFKPDPPQKPPPAPPTVSPDGQPIIRPKHPMMIVDGKQVPYIMPKTTRAQRTSVAASLSANLPFGQTTTQPNILRGMVMDQNGQIVEAAILEIRNQEGIPVRALKTNKLGQFSIATPLSNGPYEIEVEKEGLHFDIIKITVEGKIIKPIEIKAKS